MRVRGRVCVAGYYALINVLPLSLVPSPPSAWRSGTPAGPALLCCLLRDRVRLPLRERVRVSEDAAGRAVAVSCPPISTTTAAPSVEVVEEAMLCVSCDGLAVVVHERKVRVRVRGVMCQTSGHFFFRSRFYFGLLVEILLTVCHYC